MKGNANPPTEELVKQMRGNVKALLIRLGEKVTDKHMQLAEKRGVHGRFMGYGEVPITLQVWDWEGGWNRIE